MYVVDDSDYSGDDDVRTALYIIFIVKVTCSLVTLYALNKYKNNVLCPKSKTKNI